MVDIDAGTDDIDDDVIEEIVHEGRSMDRNDLFDVIERGHDERPGVPREALARYARELDQRRDYTFDAEQFLDAVDERRTDDETWVSHDRYYDLGNDRLSQYPARWHERLGGSSDAAAYVEFFHGHAPEYVETLERGGSEAAIPKDTLVDVIRVVGRTDRETAADAIEDAADSGDLVEDADQHPQAGVYLADE